MSLRLLLSSRAPSSSMHLCFSQMWKQRQHGEHWTHFFPCFYRQEAAFWEPEPHQEEPNEKFQDVVPIIFTLGFQQGKEVNFFFFIMILHTVCYRVSHVKMSFLKWKKKNERKHVGLLVLLSSRKHNKNLMSSLAFQKKTFCYGIPCTAAPHQITRLNTRSVLQTARNY